MIPLLPCCLSSTFSGFMSQWMILFLYRRSRHCSSECANFLTSCSEKPWNLFFLISSYRLMESSSNVRLEKKMREKQIIVGDSPI